MKATITEIHLNLTLFPFPKLEEGIMAHYSITTHRIPSLPELTNT